MPDFIPYENLDVKQKERVDSPDWRFRRDAAIRGEGLDKLVDDSEFVVRELVAEKGYGLDKLINDDNPHVRAAVADQGFGLDALENDRNGIVLWAVEKARLRALPDNLAGIIADITKAVDPYGVANDYATDEELIAYIKETAKDDPGVITNWLVEALELDAPTTDKLKLEVDSLLPKGYEWIVDDINYVLVSPNNDRIAIVVDTPTEQKWLDVYHGKEWQPCDGLESILEETAKNAWEHQKQTTSTLPDGYHWTSSYGKNGDVTGALLYAPDGEPLVVVDFRKQGYRDYLNGKDWQPAREGYLLTATPEYIEIAWQHFKQHNEKIEQSRDSFKSIMPDFDFEVKRNRISETQGTATVYLGEVEIASFDDAPELVDGSWRSLKSDEDFIRAVLFHPIESEWQKWSDKLSEAMPDVDFEFLRSFPSKDEVETVVEKTLFPHPETFEYSVEGDIRPLNVWRANHDGKQSFSIEITRYTDTEDFGVKVRVKNGASERFDSDLRSSFADAYKTAYWTVENMGVKLAGVADPKQPENRLKLEDALKDARSVKALDLAQNQSATVPAGDFVMQNPSKGMVR